MRARLRASVPESARDRAARDLARPVAVRLRPGRSLGIALVFSGHLAPDFHRRFLVCPRRSGRVAGNPHQHRGNVFDSE